MVKENTEMLRVQDIFDILGNDGWKPNIGLGEALRAAVEKNGDKFPQSWMSQEEKVRSRDYYLGFSTGYRWNKDSHCNVMTGGALDHVIHPTLPRRITHREAARIQGLPDSWKFEEAKTYSPLASTWGKAVALQAASWIGKAVVSALDGQPLGDSGQKIGDREYLFDTDRGFSRQFVQKTYYKKN